MVPTNRPIPALPPMASCFGMVYLLLLGWGMVYGLYHSVAWPLNGDAAIEQYVAWRLLHGAAPYRDIFEADMPGTFLLHMFCIKIFGGSDPSFRTFDLFFCWLSGAGLLALGWQRSRLYACIGALLFTVCHLALGPGDMAERDFLMVPFLLFETVALRRFLQSQTEFGSLFTFGLFAGYVFWVKPVSGMFVALCALLLMVKLRTNPQRVKALAFIAAGMMVPTAGIVAWLYSIGALPAFYTIVTNFLPIFATLQSMYHVKATIFVAATALWLFALLIFMLRFMGHPLGSTDKALLVMGLVYGLFHFFGQGKATAYHAYPFYAFMVLYFMWLAPALEGRPWEKLIVYSIVLMVIIGLSPCGELANDTAQNYSNTITTLLPQMKADTDAALQRVPAAIREPFLLKTPQYAVDFHGCAAGELWAAAYRYHWVAASRQIYPYPFYDTFHVPYMNQTTTELLHDLTAVKPLVIIISQEAWPYRANLVYDAIDTREPWKSFFSGNYILTKEAKTYRVYARIK